MSGHGPRVPHRDDPTRDSQLHERCERVAVPDFDWLNGPIVAIVDGFLHIPPPMDPPSSQERAGRRR
jgi:hypothetical protein